MAWIVASHHAEIVTKNECETDFGFFIHQGESVVIPFKYQMFQIGNEKDVDIYDEENEKDETIKVSISLILLKF